MPIAAVTGRAEIMDAPGPELLAAPIADIQLLAPRRWPRSKRSRKKACSPGPRYSESILNCAHAAGKKSGRWLGTFAARRHVRHRVGCAIPRRRAWRFRDQEIAKYCYEHGLITVTPAPSTT